MVALAIRAFRFAAPLALFAALTAFSGTPQVSSAEAPKVGEFSFHRDHVLGTSLDLVIVAPDEGTAEDAELTVLNEIERLRLVFSTYDATSEISKLNRTREPFRVSADMAEVLEKYEAWQRKSGGAFNGQVGELVRVWKEGEKANRLPDALTLERIVDDLKKPGWKLDANTNTVTRLNDQPINLNAIAKGYIIRKAALAVQKDHPSVSALLINLGGDVYARGTPPGGTGWAVGIQDPHNHFDNAPPIAGVLLKDRAIATSGGYQRFYTIGGKRYSHIFDPRTGQPASGVASSTVIANDNDTANALATTLCVLKPAEGLKLVASVPGAECLVIDADGKRHTTAGFRAFDVTPVRAAQDKKEEPKKEDPKKADAWPEGYQVAVAVEIPKAGGGGKKYRNPYTAIWIEDDKGKAVRTLAVWGNSPKYLKDLSDWWKIGKGDNALIKAVTRATRGPGKYDLVWDGKDDKGTALPQGVYTVRVEVHREFGQHVRQSGKIDCKDKDATTKLDKNAETGETVIEFKKPEKK